MTTVQLPSASDYDSHMSIYISTTNIDISFSREFQRRLSDPTRAHGLLDHGKDMKYDSKLNWNEHKYHSQDRKDVPHISENISCVTTQLPAFTFCGPHKKPHGVRGLSKHHHLILNPQLGQ